MDPRSLMVRGFAPLLMALAVAVCPHLAPAAHAAEVHVLEFDGAITPVASEYLLAGIERAEAAGVAALIVADARTDLYNPNAIRASLGTIFSTPVATCTSSEALAFLLARGIAVLAARVEGETDYDRVDLTGPVALVVGAETSGLTEAWSGEGVTPVAIPMLGLANSLNVSASAAVLFYEARRQRRAVDG
mgnify:CR=1 FL=1